MATKTVTKPKPKASDIDKLREKLQNMDLGGNAGFWSPKEGKSIIRILPAVGDMPYFFQMVGKHRLDDTGKNNIYCPSVTSDGELPCPICELVDQLKRSGDKASQSIVDQLIVSRSFWMNVVVRGSEADGVKMYTPGKMVFKSIQTLILDPDYGDITDIENGRDVIIERKGTGLKTEYQVMPRAKSTPLSDDPDLVEKWLDSAPDLSYVELSEDKDEDKELSQGRVLFILPYARIEEDFDLDAVGEDEDDDDEDEEVVRKPSKAPAKTVAKPAAKLHAKPKTEPEEDDEELDEDEDEIEEVQQEVAKRQARRSTRR